MADSDWSKRAGITINYNCSQEEDESRVILRAKPPSKPSLAVMNRKNDGHCEDEAFVDDLVTDFEHFENTPPRTKIKIKTRDWERKQKSENNNRGRTTPRPGRSRVQRRNTTELALLNVMILHEDNKRADKRAQTLLRGSEAEIKHSLQTMNTRGSNFNNQSRADSMPVHTFVRASGGSTLVESCNRYMSVSSWRVGSRSSAPPSAFVLHCLKNELLMDSPKLQSRKDFHATFANLIKLGSTDKQDNKISHEENTWQTELKDVIWLELQAWHADRTLDQQDKYLYTARQGVPDLLNQILNYRYAKKYQRSTSINSVEDNYDLSDGLVDITDQTCKGCMCMYCKDCAEERTQAFREIEQLLTRLEAAEALYPSSQALGICHPTYKCEKFVGRVKAMCLWYNITKHQQLKLIILGKLLHRLQGHTFKWPVQTSVTESSSSSTQEDSIKDTNTADLNPPVKTSNPKVQFLIDKDHESSSPIDSFSSNESATRELIGDVHEDFTKYASDPNLLHITTVSHDSNDNINYTPSLYRKYIDNVLKTRGLDNALTFLHKLHNIVLYKTLITLEKSGTEEIDSEAELLDENIPNIDPEVPNEEISELRRYGFWSAEAKALALPSYVPAFIFLSLIPLEVIHEYLRMRLETKPLKPNPLSLQQLMKELREGLTLALTHKERFNRSINTALGDNEDELEKYMHLLEQVDETIKRVFELYLDYVDQWILVAAPETHQKSVLEEWKFTKIVSSMIAGMRITVAKKFCLIISNMLKSISDRLVKRSNELSERIEEPIENNDTKKWQLLKICRETQSLFTIERERSVKILFFAKTFCRDVENCDYINTACKLESSDYSSLKETFLHLTKDVLNVRNKLTKIIEKVQDKCNIDNMMELDEQDRLAVLSRSREILHQGYKFGFEYNKGVMRLFEQRILGNDNEQANLDLQQGIISFAKMWMQFVTVRCERGRGVRPRWATHGLEFLILACDPQNTLHLSETEFEKLKSKMDACISHVIGIIPEPEKAKKKASPRTRKTSSANTHDRARTPTRTPLSAGVLINPQKNLLQSQFSLKENDATSSVDSTDFSIIPDECAGITLLVPKLNNDNNTKAMQYSPALRQIRVRDAVNHLDMELDNHLRGKRLIGQMKTLNSCDQIQIRARTVNFRWHCGIKIGQGRFGKVYTAVNNSTGELMAMKEITIQPGETRAIKKVAEELKILEGINHKNLVKYYGVEIHREELLIFMELCSEGTLESLVELSGGLYESLTRRFTAQLLSGTNELHKHGIVHRDIKTANIFLINGGNCLKLGDFGSAVKIQAHTTVPGELQGYVGTQAYMAPEVFTKTNTDGHGRAADIWSIGCVIIEMSSGKRPWSQFDSSFQIMFKVGMGETPDIPDSLSQEGFEFLEHCLQHDPKNRLSASELLQHNFCKVGLEEDCKYNDDSLITKYKSLRRNKKN